MPTKLAANYKLKKICKRLDTMERKFVVVAADTNAISVDNHDTNIELLPN